MAAGGFLSDIGGVTRVNGNLNLSRAIGDLKYKGNQGLPAAAQVGPCPAVEQIHTQLHCTVHELYQVQCAEPSGPAYQLVLAGPSSSPRQVQLVHEWHLQRFAARLKAPPGSVPQLQPALEHADER